MGTIVVIFEYRLRPGVDLAEYAALSQRLEARAASHARFGYIDMHGIETEDGAHIVVERFTDRERMRNWATDPEHRAAQKRGREEFYEWYRVTVSEVERDYGFGDVPATTEASAATP